MTITYSLKRKRTAPTTPPSPSPTSSPPQSKLARAPLAENANALVASPDPSAIIQKSKTEPPAPPNKIQRTLCGPASSSPPSNPLLQPAAICLPWPSTRPSTKLAPPKPGQKLTQLVIDLGGPAEKVCKTCGMEYVPSHADDNALHAKHHDRFVHGVTIAGSVREGLEAVGSWNRVKILGSKGRGKEEDEVLKVDRGSGKGARRLVESVLERAESELGCVRLEERKLWGWRERRAEKEDENGEKNVLPTPPTSSPPPEENEKTSNEESKETPRFAAYLYVHGNRVLGLCLAENVREAGWYLPNGPASALEGGREKQTMEATTPQQLEKSENVAVGVARIWVSPSARRKGVAGRLLDALAGVSEERDAQIGERVAFSQLTSMGEGLARKWMSRNGNERVLVYDER